MNKFLIWIYKKMRSLPIKGNIKYPIIWKIERIASKIKF